MSQTKTPLVIEVRGGPNHSARLEVDGQVRTIGRAQDADLVLADLGVSRRHVQVLATDFGVQIQACANSAAFTVAGRIYRAFEARIGDQLLLGNTVLVVASKDEADVVDGFTSRSDDGEQDVRTLLTGIGADALAMASTYALIEALDAAEDRTALAQALAVWASEQRPGCSVEVRPGQDAAGRVTESVQGGIALIVVPAPSDEPTSLKFMLPSPGERLAESLRRLLIVAGRLFGSSLSRVRRAEVADDEVLALRTLSFGSARDFLGSSEPARQLAARIPRLASSDARLLLEGETGVGKTFVARLIHEASAPRRREPFRAINCAAIPEGLVESELFGHERGAFTGASAQRVGALEAAGRGTLLLDEIGELSLASQAKFLQVLEERQFERVGSTRPLELRARVIFATNRDLDRMVAAGQFRQDLLFRIAVVRVRVPSLRERGGDLLELAQRLLADAAQSAGRRVTGFSPNAVAVLARYPWPGNVRELRNAIEHAIALGEGPVVDVGDLPPFLALAGGEQPQDPNLVRLPLDMPTLERRAIEAALRATGGNRVRAAAILNMNRTTFYSRLREYDLYSS